MSSWFCVRNDSPRPYGLSQSAAWRILFACESVLEMYHSDYKSGCEIAVQQYESVQKDLCDLYGWFEDYCGYEGWQEDHFDPLEKFWD